MIHTTRCTFKTSSIVLSIHLNHFISVMPFCHSGVVAWCLTPRTPDPGVRGAPLGSPCCVDEQDISPPRKQWLLPNMTKNVYRDVKHQTDQTKPFVIHYYLICKFIHLYLFACLFLSLSMFLTPENRELYTMCIKYYVT